MEFECVKCHKPVAETAATFTRTHTGYATRADGFGYANHESCFEAAKSASQARFADLKKKEVSA